MGRTKTRTKQRNGESKTLSVPSTSQPSILSLYEKSQKLVEQLDYELAAKFLKRILEREPSHVGARELYGVVSLELGDLSAAQQVFESLLGETDKSIVASANLYLAQLSSSPEEALEKYQKAVDVLYSQLQQKEALTQNGISTEDLREEREKICSALIAMVEIWMSDLCMEDQAEQECENLLGLAMKVDPRNTEVLQSLASVRMSQSRPEEARECVERAYGRWKDLAADDPSIPPIPTRLALTRLFLELEMYKPALEVLTGVIEADDQEVEAWYLEGWCLYLMSEASKSSGQDVEGLSWQALGQDSRDCLETCTQLFQTQGHPDQEMLAHAKELVQQLESMGTTASSKVQGEGEEGADWEDVDSEGDVEMET